MEIKIGITNIAREVIVDVDKSPTEVESEFAQARVDDSVLTYTDDRGRRVLVPARNIAYLDLGAQDQRPVGFGAV